MRATLLFLLVSTLLMGCNTVQGVGKDLEKVGEVIQQKAK